MRTSDRTKKIGEASIAAAKAVGMPSSPRVGGVSAKIIFYLIFAGSWEHRPKTLEQINAAGERLFAEWGVPDSVFWIALERADLLVSSGKWRKEPHQVYGSELQKVLGRRGAEEQNQDALL